MNETQGAWWNVVDTITGVAVGVVSILGVCFGWLGNKFTAVNKRMDAIEKDFNASNLLAATRIATLEAYHQSNTQRLDSIEDTAKTIDEKLDKLIQGLIDGNGDRNRKRR